MHEVVGGPVEEAPLREAAREDDAHDRRRDDEVRRVEGLAAVPACMLRMRVLGGDRKQRMALRPY